MRPAVPSAAPNRRGRLRLRSSRAVSLVEILVALVVGALIAGVLLDLFSKLQRVGSTTQNEICANSIAQEMVEASRNLDYKFLASRAGLSYTLLSNRTDTGQLGPDVRTDPVLLDLANKIWVQNINTAKFSGTINYSISPAPGFATAADGTPDAINITTSVSWSDSEKQPTGSTLVGRTVDTTILLTRNGMNKWMR